MNQETIAQEALVSLGLSLGEAKTFLALSSVESSEATPLAELADVPQSKIYKYLNSLQNKFQIVQKQEIEGKTNIYNALSFSIAIEQLRKVLDNNISIAQNYIREKKLEFELKKSEEKPDSEHLRVILGERAVKSKLEEFITLSDAKNFIALGVKSVIDEIREPFKKSQAKLLTLADVLDPLPPIVHLFENSEISTLLEELHVLILIEDVDFEKKLAKSFNIIGYPSDEMKIDPLFVQITHPVIRLFQIKMLLTIFETISSIDPMQIMKQMGGGIR